MIILFVIYSILFAQIFCGQFSEHAYICNGVFTSILLRPSKVLILKDKIDVKNCREDLQAYLGEILKLLGKSYYIFLRNYTQSFQLLYTDLIASENTLTM